MWTGPGLRECPSTPSIVRSPTVGPAPALSPEGPAPTLTHVKRPDPELDELVGEIFAEASRRLAEPRIPAATYRLQLHAGFPFSQAREVIPYLRELGVTDLYAAPWLRATPGSPHGYDVVDHKDINPELGGEEGLFALAETLREHGMGQLLDYVPNHMGIGPENTLWQDVLENGPSSIYARFFDIDWKPVKDELENKVLLPVLGDQYGAVLEAGDLKVAYSQGTFTVSYYEHVFPINPRQYPLILRHELHRLEERLAPEDLQLEELLSICTACQNLPQRTETDPQRITERRREKEVIKRRLDSLCESSALVREFIESNVRTFNGVPGEPRSFDLLDQLLDAQAYRLAHWRVAGEEINYRRFFDINELAAIRMEDPAVFREAHARILELLRRGVIQGLRIDHPDGLFDPREYFRRLQEEFFLCTCRSILEEKGIDRPFEELEPSLRLDWTSETRKPDTQDRPLYVVAEKILGHGEKLPQSWAVHGTTGYDFLNHLNGVFVDRSNQRAIEDIYSRFTGLKLDFQELLYQKKKLIMSTSMASEVNMLAYQLNRISEMNRRSRDFTLGSLRSAIIEYVASFPVYRTYVDGSGADERDRFYVEQAIARARRRSPVTNVSIFDFLRDILLVRHGIHLGAEERRLQLGFAMKLQQFTGPVTAKGMEDTTFYVYNRLISLNEVGGEPQTFGNSVADFHLRNAERLATARGSILTTSTHDTKRGEDVRVRIDVLSELTDEWKALLPRLSRIARKHRLPVGDERTAPDRNEEIFLYQTLIGAWPFGEMSPEEKGDFIQRIEAYVLKAAKEAKVNTSWINPDTVWDEALAAFVKRILTDDSFLAELLPLQRRIARVGIYNSLAQVVLKVVSPGVPDVYQGSEVWNFSLVDPDNRRPVDFEALALSLEEMKEMESSPPAERREWIHSLWADRESGRIKQYITWKSLQLRRAQPDLFLRGEYVPLDCAGPRGTHTVSLSRRRGFSQAIAVVPRLLAKILDEEEGAQTPWEGTYLILPSGSGRTAWTDVFTGRVHDPVVHRGQQTLPLSALFSELPVALLHPAQ